METIPETHSERTPQSDTTEETMEHGVIGPEKTRHRIAQSYGQKIRAFFAGIAAAGSINAAEPPTIPQSPPIQGSATSQDVAPHSERRAGQEMALMIKQQEWHAAMGTEKLRSLLNEYKWDPENPRARKEALRAIKMLDGALLHYPETLRKTVSYDSTLARTIDTLTRVGELNALRKIESKSIPQSTVDDIAKIRRESLSLSYRTTMASLPELIETVNQALTKEGHGDSGYAADVLDSFLDTAAILSEQNNSSEFITEAARAVDTIIPALKYREEHGMPIPYDILNVLVSSGNPDAAQIAVHILQKESPGTPPFYQDSPMRRTFLKDRIRTDEAKELYMSNPRLETFGQGVKLVAEKALESWGLDPKDFLPLWKLSTKSSSEESGSWATDQRNERILRNIHAIAQLERDIPGAMAKLAGNDWGIRHPSRYPIALLREQVIDYTEHTEDAYPKTGFILSAYEDNNAALEYRYDKDPKDHDIQSIYSDAQGLGIKTRVIEADSILDALTRVMGITVRSGNKLKFYAVRGHGVPNAITLGPDKFEGKIVDPLFLGIGSDRTSLLLEKNAPGYLLSCSTGVRGGIAERLSQYTEGQVVAPDQDTNVRSISLKEDASGTLSFLARYFYSNKNEPTNTMNYESGRFTGGGHIDTPTDTARDGEYLGDGTSDP